MAINPYQYHPLGDARTFRLIALSPAKAADQPLECIVLHASLDDHPLYASLSYEWKGEKPQLPLGCGDGTTILITPNCFAALARLRHKKKARRLWVDAVCINQEDFLERNAQVSIMIDIYRSSSSTCVWLGEGDADSDLAMQFSRRATYIYRHTFLQKLLPNGILSWNKLGTGCTPEALFSLATRSYWTRMWTIQEFTASIPILFCGSAKPAPGLCTLLAIVEVSRAQSVKKLWPQFKGELHKRCIVFNEQVDGISSFSIQYLHISRMCASDPRDKVFALKGLFRNALKDLVVDYAKPTWEVYADATRITILNEKSLGILRYVVHPAGPVRLPSWAVDWDDKLSNALLTYNASKTSPSIFRFSADGKSLHLSGKIVGEVSRDISNYFPQFDVLSMSMSFIYQSSPIDVGARNRICLQHLSAFYDNITSSIYPDIGSFFKAVVKFLDPENYYQIDTDRMISLVRQGDEQAMIAEVEDRWLFIDKLNGTVLFLTSEGRFGVYRGDGGRCGDKIALVSGFDKLVVMREVEGGYLLVSSAIVDGMMEGELWPEDQGALEEFVIL